MTHPWSDLRWWNSGERQVVEEKIDDLERAGIVCNPKRSLLYKALSATRLAEVRVAIVGQDPYPTHGMATGTAFSIPKEVSPENFPPTLRIVLDEYCSDLHLPAPSHGDLSVWTKRGVLLWNAVPSCQSGHPLSNNWDEWRYLTEEIIQRLNERGGIVFVFLGSVAASYADKVDTTNNRVIRTSHPSPRGNKFGKTPFTGSRVFSTTNAALVGLGVSPINWELKDDLGEGDVQGTGLGGSDLLGEVKNTRVLPNILGANLGGLKRQGTSPNIYTSLAF